MVMVQLVGGGSKPLLLACGGLGGGVVALGRSGGGSPPSLPAPLASPVPSRGFQILFIPFFELAPTGSIWYAISTTITRVGSEILAAIFLCLLFLLGFAVIAHSVFGYRMAAFAHTWRSIQSMLQLLMGDDAIYVQMRESR